MTLPPEALRLPKNLLQDARVLPDRLEILPLLPKGCVFVEVGVGLGDWTATVMRVCDPSLVIAVDNFKLHEQQQLWGELTSKHFGSQTHEQTIRSRFEAEITSGKLLILSGDSAEMLEQLGSRSVDVIYIDADHRYDFVRRDLEAARGKLRLDGWLIVNDYIMVDELHAIMPYGVVNATNEFMIEFDWGMQYLALQTRMYCDAVLRPEPYLRKLRKDAEDVFLRTAKLENDIKCMQASRSWRLTAPLRSMRRFTWKWSNPR